MMLRLSFLFKAHFVKKGGARSDYEWIKNYSKKTLQIQRVEGFHFWVGAAGQMSNWYLVKLQEIQIFKHEISLYSLPALFHKW
jgi:hypothetical protein